MIKLTLPYPPTINHYYGRRGNRTFILRKGLDYRVLASAECLSHGGVWPTKTSHLAVTIHAYPPDRRKRDIDNIQKCLLDALTHAGVWQDDSQIKDLRTVMCEPVKGGYVEVKITERN